MTKRFRQFGCAEHVCDALDVVCHRREADFDPGTGQSAHIDILNSSLPLQSDFILRIENPPYMRLVMEGIGAGPHGQLAISAAHYGEQNGDLMRYPERCFNVEKEGECVKDLLPYYRRNDYAGVEQKSVIFEGRDAATGKPLTQTDRAMLRKHVSFARMWGVSDPIKASTS